MIRQAGSDWDSGSFSSSGQSPLNGRHWFSFRRNTHSATGNARFMNAQTEQLLAGLYNKALRIFRGENFCKEKCIREEIAVSKPVLVLYTRCLSDIFRCKPLPFVLTIRH